MEVIGYVPPMTEINSKYVAVMKVQEWLNEGRSEKQIFLSWNAGERAKKCGKGTNKHGVKYDSCSYITKALTAYAQ